MKKRITAVLFSAALAVALCACSHKSETTDTKGSAKLDTTYDTSIYVCGTWGNFEALDAAAQLFNKTYPNIQVVYEQLENFGSDLSNRFVSGEGVDIYFFDWMLTSDSRYEPYWEHAEDLAEVLDLSAIPEAYQETGLVDGKQLMVPIYEHSYGFMVNEDLLAEHELKVPTNYEEFIHCCEVLKEAGCAPVLQTNPDFLTQIYLNHLYRTVMSGEDPAGAAEVLLSGEDSDGLLREALDRLDAFYEGEYFHPDSETLTDYYDSAIMRFFEGDIAFVPFNTANFSGTRKREAKSESFTEKPFTYSWLPSLCDDGYENVVQQLGTVYMCIYDGIEEEKRPYVEAFMQFLIDDEGSEALSSVKNMPTANQNVGDQAFSYLNGLEADRNLYVGMSAQGDSILKLNQFMRTLSAVYEPGAAADDLLTSSLARLEE